MVLSSEQAMLMMTACTREGLEAVWMEDIWRIIVESDVRNLEQRETEKTLLYNSYLLGLEY